MSGNRIALALMAILVLIPIFQLRSADELEVLDDTPARSMGEDDPRSYVEFNSSDPSWMNICDDAVSPNGRYLEIDEHKLAEVGSVKASYNSIYQASNLRSIQEYQGFTYMSYVTFEGSDVTFNIGRSSDGGANWENAVVERRNDTTDGHSGLLINEDKIFLLVYKDLGVGPQKIVDVRVTPVYNWINMSSVEPKEIVRSATRSECSMVAMPGRTILFYKNAGYDWLNYLAYDNGWGVEHTISYKVNTFYGAFLGNATDGSLNLYTVTRPDRTEVGTIESSDKGESWGQYRLLLQVTAGVTYLAGSPNGDHTDLVFNHYMNNEMEYAQGYPGTLKGLKKVATSDYNTLDPTGNELAITSQGNEVGILYEDSGGTVRLLRSRDHGNNFTLTDTPGNGNSHCASMSENMKFLLFSEGSNIVIYGFRPADSAVVRSKVISFPAIDAYDCFYIQAGGIVQEGILGFRIMSRDLSSVYFPTDGWEDLYGSEPASLNGKIYNHFVWMNLTLDSHPTIRLGIVIEVRMNRMSGVGPTIFSHAFNFSVGYPYREDFSVPENVLDSQGCTVSSSSVTLNSGNSTGYCIIGPIVRADLGPEHLSAYCKFIAGGATVTFSIQDAGLRDIEGFSGQSAKTVTEQDREVYIKWGSGNLGNLPAEIGSFCIRIDLKKGQTMSPRIVWLDLKPSESPVVEGMILERKEIMRGEDMTIRILISDKEEPVKDLIPSIKVKDPQTDSWTDSMVSDPIWNGSSWISLFHPTEGVSTGLYKVRLSVTDGLGITSDPIEMDEGILVRNNLPIPPKVRMIPDHLVSGSELQIQAMFAGSDRETAPEDISYNMSIFVDGSLREEYDDLVSPDMNTSSLDLKRGQIVRIEVVTYDNEDVGEAFVISAIVENSPPVLSPGLGRIAIDEDIPLDIDVGSYFFDADSDNLTFAYEVPSVLQLDDLGSGSIRLLSEADYHGRSFMWISASDGEETISVNVSVDVNTLNDPPLWKNPDTIVTKEGERSLIPIGSYDDADDEPVLVTSSMADLPGAIPGINLIQNPNGSCVLIPPNEMVGTHEIDVFVTDSLYIINYTFTLVVENINTPPSKPVTTIHGGSWTVFSNEKVRLTAASTDEDEVWGDSLNYTWTSSLQGQLGEGSILEPVLVMGTHLIYVNVTDESGTMNSSTVTVTVLESAVSDKSVIRTWVLYSLALVIGLTMALMVIVAFFVLTHKKKSISVEKAEEEKKKEMAALKAPPEIVRQELPPADISAPAEVKSEPTNDKKSMAQPDTIMQKPIENGATPAPVEGTKTEQITVQAQDVR